MIEPATLEHEAEPLKADAFIRAKLPRLPHEPGVYRFLDARGEVLYVGKANSLRKRVAAYAKVEALSGRLKRMVALVRGLEVVTTSSEVEALLLEANLIKRYRPPFNILLRDDKSFPYIVIRHGHPFPQIGRLRGAKQKGIEYFGPFASSGAVNETLSALLRAFPLRSCNDTIFSTRVRPCLQYQIKRCTAPCVGRIAEEDYTALLSDARAFLAGKSRDVQERLQAEMMAASENLQFESAAALRDRLKALAHITAKQGINVTSVEDADVIAAHREGGMVCVQVFFYRDGRNYGNRVYFPAHTQDADPSEIVGAFLGQFYSERLPPRLVLMSELPAESELFAEALSIRAGRKVQVIAPQRGERRKLVGQALRNAKEALARQMAESASQRDLLRRLAETIGLGQPPERIEVYDNSHIQGTDAIGSFIVSGADGLDRSQYRKFTIRSTDLTPGDDFAMTREVLGRRFARLKREDPDRESGLWPDLVVIDGGQGQLSSVEETLAAQGVENVELLAIAKGPNRNAGRETLHRPGRAAMTLDPRDPVLYLLQRLRDEAHRFAISTHRAKRAKGIRRSALDAVQGIGPSRKRALLAHFGSVQGIERAGLADLEGVPGINKAVARAVYDHFHDGG
ncbi:excinuclease ABC subunit UvrC [Marinivivus vitaminiproducens]|uniref:excinuclease ABC subunit UvrC n=1 Tax=Marinivivus vitaminiproducens TaxID=3035935 RepID=UPI0027A9D521|nr:excinuclease ABC subunit UvrC [Geminicoccaceae bacterium SCSIO 64248]